MSRTKRDHSWGIRWFTGIKDAALGRDKKPGSKPAGWWKRSRRRSRRNKEKTAMRNGKPIPTFKKCDVWEWN